LATGLKVEFKEHLKSFDLIHKCKLKCVVFMLAYIYFVFMCALELGFKYNSFQFDRVSFELEIMREIVKLLNPAWPLACYHPVAQLRAQPAHSFSLLSLPSTPHRVDRLLGPRRACSTPFSHALRPLCPSSSKEFKPK
jgi:hypothetical protein